VFIAMFITAGKAEKRGGHNRERENWEQRYIIKNYLVSDGNDAVRPPEGWLCVSSTDNETGATLGVGRKQTTTKEGRKGDSKSQGINRYYGFPFKRKSSKKGAKRGGFGENHPTYLGTSMEVGKDKEVRQ